MLFGNHTLYHRALNPHIVVHIPSLMHADLGFVGVEICSERGICTT